MPVSARHGGESRTRDGKLKVRDKLRSEHGKRQTTLDELPKKLGVHHSPRRILTKKGHYEVTGEIRRKRRIARREAGQRECER